MARPPVSPQQSVMPNPGMRHPGTPQQNQAAAQQLAQMFGQGGGLAMGGPGMGNPYSYMPPNGNANIAMMNAATASNRPPLIRAQPGSQPQIQNVNTGLTHGVGTGAGSVQRPAGYNIFGQPYYNNEASGGGTTVPRNDPMRPENNASQPGFGSSGYGYRYQGGMPVPNQGPTTNAQGQTVNPITAQLEAWRNMQQQMMQNRQGQLGGYGNLLNQGRYGQQFGYPDARMTMGQRNGMINRGRM